MIFRITTQNIQLYVSLCVLVSLQYPQYCQFTVVLKNITTNIWQITTRLLSHSYLFLFIVFRYYPIFIKVYFIRLNTCFVILNFQGIYAVWNNCLVFQVWPRAKSPKNVILLPSARMVQWKIFFSGVSR